MLKIGDIIVCNVNHIDGITYGKEYEVILERQQPEKDICIYDNSGREWWFGQVGSTECWTMWFITKLEWERNKKIENLLI